MNREFHPLVKQLMDGERALSELPPELQAEADEARRLLGAIDRRDVTFSPRLEARVMQEVREHAAARRVRATSDPVVWRWLTAPSVPPWVVGAVAAAAAIALIFGRPGSGNGPAVVPPTTAVAPESVYVKFILFAPAAKQVTLAGTFNRWDPGTTPLMRVGDDGVWTVTLGLPVGQHQYAFVVDGQRWVVDPAAPAVDDGFGRKNSVVSVSVAQGRVL
jgi:hypothetical protein